MPSISIFKSFVRYQLLITTCWQWSKFHFSTSKMSDILILNWGGWLMQTKQLIGCSLIYLSLGQPSSSKLIQVLYLIHMFVFYVLNSCRRLFQRFLLGYNWSSHQTIQLVLSWSRLVFVLVWLTCFNCNLFSSLSPGCFSFLYCLREGKYVPTFFNKVVCILNFCFYFVEGYITWYKEKYIYIYIYLIY